MKRIVKLNERDLTLIVKKVLSEQARTAQKSIPALAYQKMIDGAAYWGTDPKDIVDGINMLKSADEFYQMNDMFKDKKTGYKSFDEMIRKEFEYQKGDDKAKIADSNREDLEKITKKLKSLGVPYNYGSKNYLRDFTVLPKPAPAAPAAEKEWPDWDKVKNYLLTKGLPPDFPEKGSQDKERPHDEIVVQNKKFVVGFRNNAEVIVWRNIESSNYGVRKTWSWDGTKPVIDGGLESPMTKKAVGYATTGEDIMTGNKILGLGSRGDIVKAVQISLFQESEGKNNPGCKSDAENMDDCDGIYGKLTKKYVLDFQKRNGLRGQDGNVGLETWKYLDMGWYGNK